MNCHSFANVADLHAEGRLTARRAKAADAHLAGCADCRALLAPAPAAAPSARAPESLKERLRAAAKAVPESPAKKTASDLPLWPRETRGIALAAAALVLVGLFIAASGAPSQSAGGDVAAVEEP
jgi:hypothetical protein